MTVNLRTIRMFLWGLVAIVAVGAGMYGIWPAKNQGTALRQPAESAILAEFSLTDHNGNAVTQAAYRGKWLLVFFGYTNCPDVCPTTLNEIANVLELLGAKADRVQPLFITIDPERDTQASLAKYVAAFDRRIVGLTGTPEQIRDATDAFRAFYEKDPQISAPGGYFMSHTSYVYLFNPEGKFVIPFTYGTPSAAMAERLKPLI